MTISYSAEVCVKKRLGNFLRLLKRWKGSIYKLLYKELILYWILYFTLNLFYRFAFTSEEKEGFIVVCIFFKQYTNFVPLTFILGFYIHMVVGRWWKIYCSLGWPDSVAMRISAYVPGLDDQSRMIRRTLVRWMNLCSVLTLRSVSAAAKKRYPSMAVMESSGLIMHHEQVDLDKHIYPSHKYWVPLKWSMELLGKSRVQGYVPSDRYLIELITALNNYRLQLGSLLDYDWISVPLVYTQVVTLAVYSFFFALLFSRQYMGPHLEDMKKELVLMEEMRFVDKEGQATDPYSPVLYTTLQFLFYMGWLKVGETLINPLGLDDDDFEINWLMDRNLKYSFLIVDKMMGQLPTLKRDHFWGEKDVDIPYTAASRGVMNTAPTDSTQNVILSESEIAVVKPTPKGSDDLSSKNVGALKLREKIAEKLRLGPKAEATDSTRSRSLVVSSKSDRQSELSIKKVEHKEPLDVKSIKTSEVYVCNPLTPNGPVLEPASNNPTTTTSPPPFRSPRHMIEERVVQDQSDSSATSSISSLSTSIEGDESIK